MTDQSSYPTVPVLIVGAGPTGLTAAALLARQGVPCTVLERSSTPYPLPRAVHLDDEVLRILQAAGVGEEVSSLCRTALGMRLVDNDLRELLEIRRDLRVGVHGWPQTNMFDQPHLENVLRANLRDLTGVTVRPGIEVTGIRIRPDGVAEVTVRDIATGATSTVTARFVLGCDGAHSVVRTHIADGSTDLGFSQRWLVVDAECEADLGMWAGVHQVCGGLDSATFMQISDTRYRWEFRLPATHDTRIPFDEEKIHALLEPWAPPGGSTLRILRHTTYSHRAHVARTWRAGPLFVLGDAAHLTPPFIGQGLGAGQRDAANLTWKVAAVLRGRASEALLDTYGPERRRHVLRAVGAATLIGHVMSVPPGVPGRATHTALRGAGRLPGPDPIVRRLLEPPLRGSALTRVRRRIGPVAVGRPLPQDVAADGTRSDELLGAGFALLRRSDTDRALAEVGTRLGARTVTVTETTLPTVGSWMRSRRLREVLIRPDRAVLATVDQRGRLREPASWRSVLGVDDCVPGGGPNH